MTVRRMTEKDYDEVHALWQSCRGMGLNNVDDSREGFGRFLRRNPETCFAAECGGRIVGAILAGNDGRRGYLHHAAVHPDFRRRGIGARLVKCALDAFTELGIAKVALVVFSSNDEGNAFWEKQGFALREDLSYRNRTLTEMTRMDT